MASLSAHHPAADLAGSVERGAAGIYALPRRICDHLLHQWPGCDHAANPGMVDGETWRDTRSQCTLGANAVDVHRARHAVCHAAKETLMARYAWLGGVMLAVVGVVGVMVAVNSDKTRMLRIFIWEEYIDPAVYTLFEREF